MENPPKRALWIVGLIFGIVLLIAKVYVFGIVVAIICGLVLFTIKAEYIVLIGSSSGEVQALKSKDQIHVSRIVDAINQAMIARG